MQLSAESAQSAEPTEPADFADTVGCAGGADHADVGDSTDALFRSEISSQDVNPDFFIRDRSIPAREEKKVSQL